MANPKNASNVSVETSPSPAAPTVDAQLQKDWAAFLAEARSQRKDPTIFDAQKARGEFDTIPASFIANRKAWLGAPVGSKRPKWLNAQ